LEQKEGAILGVVDMERRFEAWWTGLYRDGPAARFLRGDLLNPLYRKWHQHAFPGPSANGWVMPTSEENL
jgi:hypothetical protein